MSIYLNINKCVQWLKTVIRRVGVKGEVHNRQDKVEESNPRLFQATLDDGKILIRRVDSIVKPASHYKLIRRFRRSRRCCGSCRDFRLTTGTLRLADARAQTDNWIGDPSAKTKPATPFPDHCMTKKCPACDNILNFRPILFVNNVHHYPL